MVVDDNIDAAATLVMLLKATGNQVEVAHDGEEAVEVALRQRPQVVLCDIGPPTLDGYEVCRAIRQQLWGQDTVMVAVTDWGQDEDRERASAAGFDRHLVKPVAPATLIDLLSTLGAALAVDTSQASN